MTTPSTAPNRSQRASRTMRMTALVVGLIAVVLLIIGLTQSGSKTKTSTVSSTNSQFFNAGNTRTLLDEIHQFGPILFPDLLHHQNGTIIYLQHAGTDEHTDWIAINARAPGAATKCILKWEQTATQFIDPCSHVSYPANGQGLTRYETKVVTDQVAVNLNKIVK